MMAREDLATDFKAALRGIASTVCIVTASDGLRRHGMTVTAVASLTMSPPALLVCLNQSTLLHDIIRVSQGFCVNVLGDWQESISRAFGGEAGAEERFSIGDWRDHADTGVPFLADAQSNLFCRKAAALPYGTHTIMVGDVIEVVGSDLCTPLIYRNAGYSALPESIRACADIRGVR